MATNVKQLIDAANAAVPRITPAQAREMIAKGNTLVETARYAYSFPAAHRGTPPSVECERGVVEQASESCAWFRVCAQDRL